LILLDPLASATLSLLPQVVNRERDKGLADSGIEIIHLNNGYRERRANRDLNITARETPIGTTSIVTRIPF
jgi:hypothetical protein